MTSNLSNFRNIGTKIVCVGRNYIDHAKELGNAVPKQPMIFLKSLNSYVSEEEHIVIPPGCQELHQEVELGVVIAKTAKNVSAKAAMDYVGGYVCALDMTARDFQNEAKKAGAPWFLAKSFDTSCPVSKFVEKSKIPDPHNVELYCLINEQEKQRCLTNKMIFDIPTLIAYVTQFATLQPGDVLLTGTPAGVCKCESGDKIRFGLKDIVEATFVVK
uniref:Oxaloacetate tautomerase FAHD1, mitochondrial n=1 Tax=Steinernema glaseri TaxID=37863 RepID=A0A1I8A591_9BILA